MTSSTAIAPIRAASPSVDRALHVVMVDEELPYPPISGKRTGDTMTG